MNLKRLRLHALAPVLSGLLFLAALGALHHTLKKYHYHDIAQAIAAIPGWRVLLALVLTGAGYLALTSYDLLAFVYVGRRLPYPKIAMTSFIGYAFSNNIGLSFLSGGSVRYRLYSNWSLSPVDIARIVLFCTVTGWIGFFGLGGLALLVEPSHLLETLRLPAYVFHAVGILSLVLVGSYFAACGFWRKLVRVRDVELEMPSLRLAAAQLVVAFVDLSLAAGVVYMLLPAGYISYPAFLGVYLVALIAGLLSQIPGGIGVFETVILVLLSPRIPPVLVLGALIAYRAIYYLLPLTCAVVALSGYEVHQRRAHVFRFARGIGNVFPSLVPRLVAFMTFMGGIVLLLSGATPAARGRIDLLRPLLPLPVLEASHFLGSLAGVGLLLLARGLERRLDFAYLVSLVLLALGAIVSLLKGFDYEEAAVLAIMFAALLPCRSYFYRKAAITDQKFSWGWMASVALVIVSVIWLSLFAHKHVEYSNDLWWKFSFSGDAPRALRATVGILVAALIFGVARLMRPVPRPPHLPTPDELERAAEIVTPQENTSANLALLGDKDFLFSESGESFIMYAIEGRSWVAMGDPVGPAADHDELVWQYYSMCDDHGAWPVFYLVQPESLPLYLDLGHNLLKLGEEGRVYLPDFSVVGNDNKDRRHTINKTEREEWTFDLVPPEKTPELLPQLKRISDNWLEHKKTREKGFSLGFFSEEYVRRFPIAVIRREEEIAAFANVWVGANKRELSIDLMRYADHAPPTAMDYLFLRLMLWGKEEGYQWFNMGMAPLSGLENRSLAPMWHRVGSLIYRHGEHFYNFRGLRQYKEKYNPVWHPRYLAFPGGLSLPIILTNIAALISGGMRGVVAK